VDALRVNGIEAAYLNSSQTYQEQDAILNAVRLKKLKLLYLAPEKLLGNAMTLLKTLRNLGVSLIAIDEAHCISHWGHDFRPEYLMLSNVKESFPEVPVIALTATADKITQKDIVEKLELTNPAIFISSFNRPNIRYVVEPKNDSFNKLLDFLSLHNKDSGIIYCLSRKSTETLVADLGLQGFKAVAYHAGMDREQRSKNQDLFLRDHVRIIVATIAFGMGIDKSNVRYVVHMDLPKNIESYYQETGRAGRDGLDSEALLFYSFNDVSKLKRFALIENNAEQTEILLKKLDQMGRYGELVTCRRKYLLNYFDEKAGDHCGNCDVCLSKVELFDATILAQKVISAVARLQEKFGASYVIDILRGSHSARILEGHKALKIFGAGADMSREAWNKVVRELVERGYLLKSDGMYPVLRLAANSEAVLKGEHKVMLTQQKIKTAQWQQPSETAYETKLLDKLKEVRRKLAAAENLAPYIVLSDAALTELAMYLPQNLEDLRKVSGFGELKVQKYGTQFLETVVDYCDKHKLSSRIHMKAPKRTHSARPERENETKQQSVALLLQGKSVEEIAALRKLSPLTVESHLAFYIERGKLSVAQLMDISRMPAIEEAIAQTGGNMLSPVKTLLGESYSYAEIRYVMAHRNRLESERKKIEVI
jgi:ATP-dependent DNA helicase RecQ